MGFSTEYVGVSSDEHKIISYIEPQNRIPTLLETPMWGHGTKSASHLISLSSSDISLKTIDSHPC